MLIATLSFQSIQDNYYGPKSYEVAAVNVDSLELEGDSLYWAMNYVSRANHKINNFDRAHELSEKLYLNIDSIGHQFLRYEVYSLHALTAKNVGNYQLAEQMYDTLFTMLPEDENKIQYRSHLNYADLLRLKMDYNGREEHLKMAMANADSKERNKVIRVLARHYFKVMYDFSKAERILRKHDSIEMLGQEDLAGLYLVKAEMAEFRESYKKAKEYYKKASNVAKKASFVSFKLDAIDGVMRSKILKERKNRSSFWKWAVNITMLVFAIGYFIYNHFKNKSLYANNA